METTQNKTELSDSEHTIFMLDHDLTFLLSLLRICLLALQVHCGVRLPRVASSGRMRLSIGPLVPPSQLELLELQHVLELSSSGGVPVRLLDGAMGLLEHRIFCDGSHRALSALGFFQKSSTPKPV